MKMKFSELAMGSCCIHGKNQEIKKKVGEHKALMVRDNGKVSTRKVKGDPDVDSAICPLRYLGVGLRKHPDTVVEIGDGNILARRQRGR